MRTHFYLNAGAGDNIGVRVNLNPRRPRYHAAREDWVQSGRAVCGANISRPGWEFNGTPPEVQTCRACLRRLEASK